MTKNQFHNWKKVYGFKNIILRGINEYSPFIYVGNDRSFRRLNWQRYAKERLKKFLVVNNEQSNYEEADKVIWWLWFQGSTNCPLIVQKCLESVKKYSEKSDYKLIVLDNNNLFDYVNLPNSIINKWHKGIIGNANFSDLCRLALLDDYGGIWIDSTVFITEVIPKEILDAEIFFFQASFLDYSMTRISSWFICSKYKHEPIISSVKDSMINYWENTNKIEDYFAFHLMTSLILNQDCFKKRIDKIPYYSNTYPQLLLKNINNEFDASAYESIIGKSFLHKLSYKNIEENDKNTFYSHILNEKL